MERKQEDVYRAYLAEVASYRDTCDDLHEKVSRVLGLLDELDTHQREVSDRTSSLQNACQQLLDKQTHLSHLSESVNTRLSYFAELDTVSRLLNAPGDQVVLDPAFVPTLRVLDRCITYLQQNMAYKDSELYLLKFRQCMVRALSLLRLHASNVFRDTAADILTKPPTVATDASGVEAAMLHAKFRALAPTLRPMIAEIEHRQHLADYVNILLDCQHNYFSVRESLLMHSGLRTRIGNYGRAPSLLDALQAASADILRTSLDEYRLFELFFIAQPDAASPLISYIANALHQEFRPRIIRETSVDRLAEVSEMMLSQLARHASLPDSERSVLSNALQGTMEDVQQRLTFRVQMTIGSEIEYYVPAPADINFPERLGGPNDAPYTALQRCMVLITRLSRTVHPRIFDSLSQEVLLACINNLYTASAAIAKRSTHIDARLFLIRSFLALREHLQPFHTTFVHTESLLDFEQILSAAQSLLARSSKLLTWGRDNSLLSFVQDVLPKSIVVSRTDARKELDTQLKRACEELLALVAREVTQVVEAATVKLAASGTSMTRDDVAIAASETTKQITNRIPSFLLQMHSYLKDKQTELVLYKVLRGSIVTSYAKFIESAEAAQLTTAALPTAGFITHLVDGLSLPVTPVAPTSPTAPTVPHVSDDI